MNQFKITDYTATLIRELRMLERFGPDIPEHMRDEDYWVRITGRCVDGPAKEHKVMSIQWVTSEFYAEPTCRAYLEGVALADWAKLQQPQDLGQ